MSQRKVISSGVLSFGAALTAGAVGYSFAAFLPGVVFGVFIIAFIFGFLSALSEESL